MAFPWSVSKLAWLAPGSYAKPVMWEKPDLTKPVGQYGNVELSHRRKVVNYVPDDGMAPYHALNS